ncbi:MAG TPA: cation transporter [Verrucomicrobiota bacterium]|mgnify:CR=1 FL=1|nr:cation transporter [Verrucomicrobiota bacterium]
MNKSLRLLAAAALLAAVPVAYANGQTCASACSATKTTKAGATCSATTAVAAKTDACCASQTQQVVLKVKESACSEATTGFSMAVAKLDGIKAVDTCGQSHMTKISYDGSKVCTSKIFATLKTAGYHVEAQRVSLAVAGLNEGSCSASVSKIFTSVQGVTKADVCTSSKHAVVEFNPELVSVDKLLAAASSAGYSASPEVN